MRSANAKATTATRGAPRNADAPERNLPACPSRAPPSSKTPHHASSTRLIASQSRPLDDQTDRGRISVRAEQTQEIPAGASSTITMTPSSASPRQSSDTVESACLISNPLLAAPIARVRARLAKSRVKNFEPDCCGRSMDNRSRRSAQRAGRLSLRVRQAIGQTRCPEQAEQTKLLALRQLLVIVRGIPPGDACRMP